MPQKGLTSAEGLLRKISKTAVAADEVLFYRGHSDKDFILSPSLFRNAGHKESEDRMFRELVAINPLDFEADRTTLEVLVRMQHHKLPTRLLDVTSNALMAFYFACCENLDKTAELIVFRVKKDNVKFYDSDTASCIANLAKLGYGSKEAMDFALDVPTFNATAEAQQLIHHIREERPYFQGNIEPRDLKRILCVKTKMSNERIVAQAGAFLLFGQQTLLTPGDPHISFERIRVNGGAKRKILTELDALNINESTVFPSIERSASYVNGKYRV